MPMMIAQPEDVACEDVVHNDAPVLDDKQLKHIATHHYEAVAIAAYVARKQSS